MNADENKGLSSEFLTRSYGPGPVTCRISSLVFESLMSENMNRAGNYVQATHSRYHRTYPGMERRGTGCPGSSDGGSLPGTAPVGAELFPAGTFFAYSAVHGSGE